jgi:hypothetical protein
MDAIHNLANFLSIGDDAPDTLMFDLHELLHGR